MGKGPEHWPLHRMQTLLVFSRFQVGEFVRMGVIIGLLRDQCQFGKINLIYKNMYSLYEDGYIQSKLDDGQKDGGSYYALTSYGAETISMLKDELMPLIQS